MRHPERPPNEMARLAAVKALGLVGVDSDHRFDSIVRVAKRVLGVPMVAVSLIDDDRQWFAGMSGLPTRETTRDVSFCGHAILTPQELFEVPDALADERFFDNPLVTGAPHIRFYAGVPVVSSDRHAVGTLCVLDSEPRTLTAEEEQLLRDLALLVQAKLRSLEVGSLEFEVHQRRLAERRTRQQERRLAALYAVASSPRHDTEHVLREALELGRRELSLEMGMLTRIEGDSYSVEVVLEPNDSFVVGSRYRLAESYCALPVAAMSPVVCANTSADERFAPFKALPVGVYESYAGTPVQVEGKLYGTLVFWQHEPREEPFTQADIDFLALMTQLVSSLLERRAMIARLVHAREVAERASSAKNTFLATVSHELRTPMNAVLGMNRLVLGTELDPSQRELLTDATTAASHLLKLLDDVLDFSRHEANEVTLDVVPLCFDQVIHDSLRSVSPAAHRSGVELISEVDGDLPESLLGDPDRLAQVVRNLVGNALKFTRHGSVRVHVGGEWKEPGQLFAVHITVSDTGVGMPPEDLERIFLPFTQRDGSSSRRYGGTGLGLTIVERIVSAMSGSVSVESTVGKGSSFRVEVLLGADPRSRSAPARWDIGFERALLVEDDADARRVFVALMAGHGVDCAAVASLHEARRLLARARADGRSLDVVFVDEHVGGGEAWAFCEEVQAGPEQVVVLAASEDRVALERRVSAIGSARSLWKPVTRTALRGLFLSEGAPAIGGSGMAFGADAGRYKVLVAEDNALNRKLLGLMLERDGLEVDAVESGRAAVMAASQKAYDVVLMDIQMPDMDGLAASRAIRYQEREVSRRTPIIAVTASALAGDREHFLNEGLDGYVAKPIDPAQLRSVLGSVLRSRASQN